VSGTDEGGSVPGPTARDLASRTRSTAPEYAVMPAGWSMNCWLHLVAA